MNTQGAGASVSARVKASSSQVSYTAGDAPRRITASSDRRAELSHDGVTPGNRGYGAGGSAIVRRTNRS